MSWILHTGRKWINRLINWLFFVKTINRFVSISDCILTKTNVVNCFFYFFYHDQSNNNNKIDWSTITSSIQVLWQPICQSGDGQNIIYREQTALFLVVTIVVAVNSRKGKHFCSAQNKQDMNHTQKANFEQETQIRWMEDFLKQKNIGVPHFWDSYI